MSVKENPDLITTGPYSYIRHPIYSGMALAMLGSVLASSVLWIVVLIIVGIYFVYGATREEALMLKQFPDTYPAYKRRTKMFIPFIF